MDESATKASTDETTHWRRVSPLSLVFFVIDVGRNIARNFVQVGVPTIAFLASTGSFTRERLSLLGFAALAVTLLYAAARYLNTRFCFERDGVVLRTGVFARKQLNVEYERIQALNLSQNLIYRWFGLYDLAIDSAGSVDSEIVLPAVTREVVDALRARLPGNGPVASAATGDVREQDEALLRLTDADMLRIGISSERSLVLLAVIGSALGAAATQGWVDGLMARFAPAWIRVAEQLSFTEIVAAGITALAVIILLFVALSIAGAFVRFFRYTLIERAGEFVSRAGLVTVRTQTLPLKKVQRVDVVRGLVHRWLGCVELSVQQAAGKEHQEKGEFVIPLVRDAAIPALARRLLDDAGVGFLRSNARGVFHRVHRYYWFARWRFVGLLPALAMSVVLVMREAPPILFAALPFWLIVTALTVWQSYRRWGYYVFSDGIAIRRGLIGERIETMLWRKIQYVALRETPFLERRGLCHLVIVTAAGQRRLPFVPRDQALTFADTALYRAESDPRAWI